jgi:hypothetical protein
MIAVGTVLRPRDVADPVAVIVGAEPENGRYMLAAAEKFSAVWAMGFDEITASYVCDGYRVDIPKHDEAAAWAKLSSETFHRKTQAQLRNAKKAAELPSPEEVFAQQAAAKAVKK